MQASSHLVNIYSVVHVLQDSGHINWLASVQGRPKTLEKHPYTTLKSNPSKVLKTLAGPIVHLK